MPHQTWRRRARNREGTGVARRHVGGRLGARPMLFVGRDMRMSGVSGRPYKALYGDLIDDLQFAMEISSESSLL